MLYLTLGLLAAYAFGINSLANSFLSPQRSVPGKPPEFQEITLDARAGKTPAWVTKDWQSAPLVFVMIHGYGGSRGQWDGLIKRMTERGYGSIALAMPGHDTNVAEKCGFGTTEGDITADAVKFVRSNSTFNGGPKIILVGVSLGGAAVWRATTQVAVDGVVIEGSFPDFEKAIRQYMSKSFGWAAVLAQPAVSRARSRSGLPPVNQTPLEAARLWHGRPGVVIHGTADKLFPLHNGEEIAAASGLPLWKVEGATHANCYLKDERGYCAHVLAVVDEVMKTPAHTN